MPDTKEIIKCPACGAEMKKVYIESKEFNLDLCENCGGILFDNNEFKHFDEQHEDMTEIEKALEGKTFENQDETKERICPVCLCTMVKNFSSVLREVQVDECYGCGAKFLDGNELQKIREKFKTEEERKERFNKEFFNEFSTENIEKKNIESNLYYKSIILKIFDKIRR